MLAEGPLTQSSLQLDEGMWMTPPRPEFFLGLSDCDCSDDSDCLLRLSINSSSSSTSKLQSCTLEMDEVLSVTVDDDDGGGVGGFLKADVATGGGGG